MHVTERARIGRASGVILLALALALWGWPPTSAQAQTTIVVTSEDGGSGGTECTFVMPSRPPTPMRSRADAPRARVTT